MKLIKCLTKSNMVIKMTITKQFKSASPTKMKRYLYLGYRLIFVGNKLKESLTMLVTTLSKETFYGYFTT